MRFRHFPAIPNAQFNPVRFAFVRKPRKRFPGAALVCLLAIVTGFTDAAQAQFYQGKRITFLINYTAGGPTDIEGRIVAQHLGKHIPGNPVIVVKNMPGAGGIAGTNFMGEVARPDGLTVAFFGPPLTQQLLQDSGLRVDLSEFVWLGGIGLPLVCFIRKDAGTGIDSAENLLELDGFKVAGLRPTTSLDLRMRMALDLLGARYRYVTGYRGLANLVAGIMQNEVQFSCGTILTFRQIVEPNLIGPGLAVALWYFPATGPDGRQVRDARLEGIPTFIDVHERLKGRKPEGRLYDAFRMINNTAVAMQRASFVPAGTPDEAVDVLRSAWEALPRDEDFVSDYIRLVKAPPALVQVNEVRAHVEAMRAIAPDTAAFIREFVRRQ